MSHIGKTSSNPNMNDGQGLTRSATLSSHNKNPSVHQLHRSVSVSTQANHNSNTSDSKTSTQSPISKKRNKVKNCPEESSIIFSRLSGSFNEPWEMYFDPNYTFFGGTVLERRKNRQQQDVLQAMALQDQHLHLHPPPSNLKSWVTNDPEQSLSVDAQFKTSATTFLDQPTLPLAVMNSVHFQLFNDQIQRQVNPHASNASEEDNKGDCDLGLQQRHHTSPSYPLILPSHVSEQENYARLALLQAIRTETYHRSTFSSSTGTNTTHPNQQVLSTDNQSHPPLPRRTSLRWMEKKAEELKYKCQTSSSALNLTNLQVNSNIMTPEGKTTLPPIQNGKRVDSLATKTMPAKKLVAPPKKAPQCRLSFLYFIFGFIFPPIWIIGALYTPPEKKYQSSKGRRIDLMWKRACRLAFGVFVFALLILLVAILALNPGALGWRTSRSDQNSAQKFIPVVVQPVLTSMARPSS